MVLPTTNRRRRDSPSSVPPYKYRRLRFPTRPRSTLSISVHATCGLGLPLPPDQRRSDALFKEKLLGRSFIRICCQDRHVARATLRPFAQSSSPEKFQTRQVAANLTVTPRGVLKPEGKSLRVINEKSDKFHDESRIAVLGIQYAALGKDVMPGLHRTSALTLMCFVVGNVEPPIVLACRGMIGDRTCKAGTESIVIIDML